MGTVNFNFPGEVALIPGSSLVWFMMSVIHTPRVPGGVADRSSRHALYP